MALFYFFKNINQIEKFKYYLNLQHTNIKFFSAIVMNNSLSFLGIKIVRENNKFTISIYPRNFSWFIATLHSYIPNSYKYALIFHCCIELSNFALTLNCFTKKLKI